MIGRFPDVARIVGPGVRAQRARGVVVEDISVEPVAAGGRDERFDPAAGAPVLRGEGVVDELEFAQRLDRRQTVERHAA